jgi:hypothetical protein
VVEELDVALDSAVMRNDPVLRLVEPAPNFAVTGQEQVLDTLIPCGCHDLLGDCRRPAGAEQRVEAIESGGPRFLQPAFEER